MAQMNLRQELDDCLAAIKARIERSTSTNFFMVDVECKINRRNIYLCMYALSVTIRNSDCRK